MTCSAGISWESDACHHPHRPHQHQTVGAVHFIRPFTPQEDPSQRDHHQDIERRESERSQIDCLPSGHVARAREQGEWSPPSSVPPAIRGWLEREARQHRGSSHDSLILRERHPQNLCADTILVVGCAATFRARLACAIGPRRNQLRNSENPLYSGIGTPSNRNASSRPNKVRRRASRFFCARIT